MTAAAPHRRPRSRAFGGADARHAAQGDALSQQSQLERGTRAAPPRLWTRNSSRRAHADRRCYVSPERRGPPGPPLSGSGGATARQWPNPVTGLRRACSSGQPFEIDSEWRAAREARMAQLAVRRGPRPRGRPRDLRQWRTTSRHTIPASARWSAGQDRRQLQPEIKCSPRSGQTSWSDRAKPNRAAPRAR